jgi:predicted secreted hydrolase
LRIEDLELKAKRRRVVLASLAGLLAPPGMLARNAGASPPVTRYAPVVPGYEIRFPHDHGAHPEFRTEWWYVTGTLDDPAGAAHGFQITFFRARPELKHDNPSAFAPRQLLIAHAALSDSRLGRLQHDQRVAREGFGLASAATGSTRVAIDDWSFEQQPGGYRATIAAREFRFDFALAATQRPMLNGRGGVSRKGPRPEAASYYYSVPQLGVSGTWTRGGRAERVSGIAWLDHEWSSSYLEPEAAGWDWIGINALDGGALMAFRMRGRDGAVRWAGATHRDAAGRTRVFDPGEIRFTPKREWRSPRTGTTYPVAMEVQVGDIVIALEPLIDDQELDARLSSGTVYWEGAMRASRGGNPFGRGYLELTGYWRALKL